MNRFLMTKSKYVVFITNRKRKKDPITHGSQMIIYLIYKRYALALTTCADAQTNDISKFLLQFTYLCSTNITIFNNFRF